MRNHPAEAYDTAVVVTAGGPDQHKHRLRDRALEEAKKFLVMTLYLWVLFALFSLYKTIILEQNHVNYQDQGFAIVNALVLAKVMLVAEDLRLGTRFKELPLIYPVLHKSFAFAVVLVCFHIVEKAAVALLHGRPLAESLGEIGGGGLKGIVSVGAIVFVALIPFFMFGEIARVIGADQLTQLAFRRGTKTFTLLVQERGLGPDRPGGSR